MISAKEYDKCDPKATADIVRTDNKHSPGQGSFVSGYDLGIMCTDASLSPVERDKDPHSRRQLRVI